MLAKSAQVYPGHVESGADASRSALRRCPCCASGSGDGRCLAPPIGDPVELRLVPFEVHQIVLDEVWWGEQADERKRRGRALRVVLRAGGLPPAAVAPALPGGGSASRAALGFLHLPPLASRKGHRCNLTRQSEKEGDFCFGADPSSRCTGAACGGGARTTMICGAWATRSSRSPRCTGAVIPAGAGRWGVHPRSLQMKASFESRSYANESVHRRCRRQRPESRRPETSHLGYSFWSKL